jgi:DnaJ-class molecular chaperone
MSGADPNELYSILGVGEGAGPEDLRKAYLRLAVKYHPDRNPGDPAAEEHFKDISQAYAILSDPAARARYERLRSKQAGRTAAAGPAEKKKAADPKESGAAGGEPKTGRASSSPGTGARPAGGAKPEPAEPGLDEILANFFKTPQGRETLRDLKGELGRVGLNFSLEEFADWLKAKRPAAENSSRRTGGSFFKALLRRLPGAGFLTRIKSARYDVNCRFALTAEAAASGAAVEISYLRDELPRQIKVSIPAGTRNGARLRLAGQGRLRPDNGRGDLVLTVLVAPDQTLNELWKKT